MCFTGTWLNPVTMDIYKIDGFQGFHIYRPTKKGGGVSLYQYTLKLIWELLDQLPSKCIQMNIPL